MEKENKKGAKSKKKLHEGIKTEIEEDVLSSESLKIKSKSKKKIKNLINNNDSISEEAEDESEDVSIPVKKHKHKKKTEDRSNSQNDMFIKEEVYIKDEVAEVEEEPHTSDSIDWPQSDLSELIAKMEIALPEKDSLAYGTRAEKLNWEEIAFNNYTGEDCKRTWFLIQKRVRRFRLLSEILQDAKQWISKPWTNFYRGNKTKRHPDMPRRPLSVYMIFYLKKKDKILSENPGLEMTEVSKLIAQLYKNISPAKRAKYMQLAADERRNYEEKLEEFYRLHPEIPRSIEKPNHTKSMEVGPKKPLTPFGLYYEEQLKRFPADTEMNRNSYKEQCKEKWRSMSGKKKVIWIDWALDKEAKYLDELKNYKSRNPNFSPILKPVLTKEEKLLKERLAGKPTKPPNSAYSLFSRMMLQSEEIKKIPSKDRMKTIADQWKGCSDKEKKQYRERATHMMEQYKLDFASYLESLPEEKRQEELQNNLPKRKTKAATDEKEPVKKKKKQRHSSEHDATEINEQTETTEKTKENELNKIFDAEPIQPPVSGFSLFSKGYSGKAPVETVWKNISKQERREYEEEVKRLKQKYIKEYEKFLKSLSKDQLTAFSQLRRKKESADDGTEEKSEVKESAYSCDSDDSEEEQSSDENSDED